MSDHPVRSKKEASRIFLDVASTPPQNYITQSTGEQICVIFDDKHGVRPTWKDEVPPLQNYDNHVRHDYKLYAAGAGFAVAATLHITAAYTGNGIFAVSGWIVLTMALLGSLLIVRRYALMVQNRIVRLETRLRLERILPADLVPRVKDLTLPQLIGLRFASDEELPDLVRRVFSENLATADSIKRLVKDWQPDYMRV